MAQKSSYRARCLQSVSLLASLVACASASARPDLATSALLQNAPTAAHSRYVSAADLASAGGESTLEALRRIHPEFLRASTRAVNPSDPSGPSVYIDRVYTGEVSWLSLIPAHEIRDIAFLHPLEAHQQFGTRCPCSSGVVVVRTNQYRDP